VALANVDPVKLKENIYLSSLSLVEFRKHFFPSDDEVEPAPFHFKWDEIILRGSGNFAIEGFRESAKTQYAIRGNLLHALTFPRPDRDYVLIVCATKALAEKRLKEVVDEWLSNPMLSYLKHKIIQQNGDAFEVAYRREIGKDDGFLRRVRLETYGKGSSIRGAVWRDKRPSLVVIDDPQDTEDSRSSTVLDADWDWFLSDIHFLGNKSRIFLIGNNLGKGCIIERIFEAKDALGWRTMRVPAMVKGNDGDMVSTWPAKLTVEQINQERDAFRSLGKIDVWYREKMCKAISPDSQLFKEAYFRYYDPLEFKTQGMDVFTTVDLAISEKSDADYTAVCTVAVNEDNQWFILDVDYGRYNPSEQIDAVFRAVKKYRPIVVGIERVAYQAALEHFLLKEMPMRNTFFRIEPLKAKGRKDIRIESLQPRFSTGSIWFPKDAHWVGEMKEQLLTFPKGLHDDLPDALAYTEQFATVPIHRRTSKPKNARKRGAL
jgi:predicted phage terminase large subunit-like protein